MPRTARSLHNAFTEVMKAKPHLIPERTRILKGNSIRVWGLTESARVP